MTRIYNILRALFVTVFAIAIIGPLVLYVVLSISGVQRGIGNIAEKELGNLLGADVKIGNVDFAPFNKLTLRNVTVCDSLNDTILSVDRIGAGVVMSKLLLKRRIIFSYAEVLGLNVNIHRDSLDSPLNIQPIINRLSSKDKTKPPSQYDLRVNNIVIRKANLNYDVLSEPHLNKFDKNHIRIRDLKADILLPKIKNDDYRIALKRLALKERSGIYVESLSGDFAITDTMISVENFNLKLAESRFLFGPVVMHYSGLNNLGKKIFEIPIQLEFLSGTCISTSDVAPFVPKLDGQGVTLTLDGNITGTISNLDIHSLRARTSDSGIDVMLNGHIAGLPTIDSLDVNMPDFEVKLKPSKYLPLIKSFIGDKNKTLEMISRIGDFQYQGVFDGRLNEAFCDGHFETSIGQIDIDAAYRLDSIRNKRYLLGNVDITSFDIGRLLDNKDLGIVSANIDADAVFTKNEIEGDFDVALEKFIYKGYEYNNATFNGRIEKNKIDGSLALDDENVDIKLEGWADFSEKMLTCDLSGRIRNFNPNALNLLNSYPGYSLNTDIIVNIKGNNPEHADGRAELARFNFKNTEGEGVELNRLTLLASGTTTPQFIVLRSDIFEGQLTGNYSFKDILPAGKRLLSTVFPSLLPVEDIKSPDDNNPTNFVFNFEIRENETTNNWLEFLKSPVKLLHPVTIESSMDYASRNLKLTVDAPYLLKKDKFIDNTSFQFNLDGEDGTADMYFTTLYPTKNGGATIRLTGHGKNDILQSQVSWDIDSKRRFDGLLNLSAAFSKCLFGGIDIGIGIEKSHFVINDTAWVVQPASIDIAHNKIKVNDIDVGRSGQFIKIGGIVSDNPDDILTLELNDMSLDYVFETLA